MTLDSAHIGGLLDIYDNYSLPGIYSRNILVTAGYLTYQEPYLFPDNLKKMVVKPESGNISENPVTIKVFPNPAAYYAIVEFVVLESTGITLNDAMVSIIVRDVRGITQKTLTSTYQKDQLVLDVRSFIPGLYFVDLMFQGQRMATTKLLVER
jgi:hypothetical protein